MISNFVHRDKVPIIFSRTVFFSFTEEFTFQVRPRRGCNNENEASQKIRKVQGEKVKRKWRAKQ